MYYQITLLSYNNSYLFEQRLENIKLQVYFNDFKAQSKSLYEKIESEVESKM